MAKKQPKLTPWFPIATEPARDGVYEVRTATRPNNGRHWHSEYRGGVWLGTSSSGSPAEASKFGRLFGRTCDSLTHWRGLAEKPQ